MKSYYLRQTNRGQVSVWYLLAAMAIVEPLLLDVTFGNKFAGTAGIIIGFIIGLGIGVLNFYVSRMLGAWWWRWRIDDSINWQVRAPLLLFTLLLWTLVSALGGGVITHFLARLWTAGHLPTASA